VYIYIPNIKSCITVGMFCKTTLSTVYTTSLESPYTLNKVEKSLSFINASIDPAEIAGGTAPI